MRRFRVSPSLVLAVAAVVFSVTGSAVAAKLITGKDVKDGSIGAKDLSREVQRQLARKGARGPAGSAGPAGRDGAAGVPGRDGSPDTPAQVRDKLLAADGSGSGVDADRLDGEDSAAYVRYGSVIPSGVTVRGIFGLFDEDRDTGQAFTVKAHQAVSLPAEAPVALTSSNVNFAPADPVGGDDDSTCTGNTANPVAPPGKVCLYPATTIGLAPGTAFGFGGYSVNGKYGFTIEVEGSAVGGTAALVFTGVWAYTAP